MFGTYRNNLAHSTSDTSFQNSHNKSSPRNNSGNNDGPDNTSYVSVSSDCNDSGIVSMAGVDIATSPDQQQLQQQQQQQQPANSVQQPLTLLQAVISGDVRKVRKMVVKGVSASEANERDLQGRTPLSIACSNGMVLTVEFLSFIPEIDPNKADNEGNTPLLLASQAGHVDCVRILLKEFRNVKLDHQNRKGYTALIQAAINGRTDCAKILMESGANPFLADQVRKKNALQWAEFCGRTPCAAAIKEMSGRFPILVRHLVQAGQSVLSRHRSIWGSDGEINRLAEKEELASKDDPDRQNERRGTISRLIKRSAKWIRSLSKRRTKHNYKSLSALVSVGLSISGPLAGKQVKEEQTSKSPSTSRPQMAKGTNRRPSAKSNRGPQSPPWQIPEVQIIAPSDDFCGRFSMSSITNVPNSDTAPSVPHRPADIVITTSDEYDDNEGSSNTGSNRGGYNKQSAHEKWGQNASAPSSPVLSNRSAERAHRRRFAQRAAATTNRQYSGHHSPTAYHDSVLAAAEHLNAIAAAAGDNSCTDFAFEDEEDLLGSEDEAMANNELIGTATTGPPSSSPAGGQYQQKHESRDVTTTSSLGDCCSIEGDDGEEQSENNFFP